MAYPTKHTDQVPLRLILNETKTYEALLHVTVQELHELLALKPTHPAIKAVEDDPLVFVTPGVLPTLPRVKRWSEVKDTLLATAPRTFLFVVSESLPKEAFSYSSFSAR